MRAMHWTRAGAGLRGMRGCCSQSRSAATLRLNARANSSCDIASLARMAFTSTGSITTTFGSSSDQSDTSGATSGSAAICRSISSSVSASIAAQSGSCAGGAACFGLLVDIPLSPVGWAERDRPLVFAAHGVHADELPAGDLAYRNDPDLAVVAPLIDPLDRAARQQRLGGSKRNAAGRDIPGVLGGGQLRRLDARELRH